MVRDTLRVVFFFPQPPFERIYFNFCGPPFFAFYTKKRGFYLYIECLNIFHLTPRGSRIGDTNELKVREME